MSMGATPIISHGNGHQRVGTQSMSGLSLAATKMLARRQEGPPSLPFSLHSLLFNNVRFRILVVGARGSGKSSLIKAIFKVDLSGSPINIYRKIAEFCPRDNDHVMVYECSASGSEEMQVIQAFISAHNHEDCPASERLHAIWICVPMSDVDNGQFDEAVVRVLLGTGVPVVIVFTKFDLIVPNVSSRNYEDERARARSCPSLFRNVPTNIVSICSGFRDLIDNVVATTDEVIIASSRNISASSAHGAQRVFPVTLAWSVSQRASRDINIEAAIAVGRNRYWCRLWSSDDFRGKTLADCIEVIHADIVGTWNFLDTDEYLSSKGFKAEISYVVQDLSGSPMTTLTRPNCTQGMGATWLNRRYTNSEETTCLCLVAGYIVDLTLILCRVFTGNLLPSNVHSEIDNFTRSSLKTRIHDEIRSFTLSLSHYEYRGIDVVAKKICDLISLNCNEPFDNAHI